MKRVMLWASAVCMVASVIFASVGCTVEAGVDPGGVCEEVSCQQALVGGLDVQGDALCTTSADAAYGDIFTCACGDAANPGPCTDACGDNLCTDTGETPGCGDCLAQFCAPEHDACANN